MRSLRTFAVLAALACNCAAAVAADMTARDVTVLLFKSASGERPDLSGKDLSNLDLSNLDFHQSRLANARLFGADLSQANLSGADLSGAHLDRTILIGSRFDGANLEGASILRPSVFSTLAAQASEAPSFKNARMRGSKIFGRFTRASFEGADLTDATCAPFGKTGFIEEIWRTEMSGANLSAAILVRADLTHALLTYANLRGADLTNAVLKNADLTGADLSGANASGVDFEGAILKDVKGFSTVVGLGEAKNIDKVLK
jgi:uncharacterized protein YjbI with pentapeptide repeats